MAKAIPDAILDSMLDECEGDIVHVCSAEPTTFTEASVTFQLASQAITGANFTAANGDTNGRKNTLAPPSGTAIDNTGVANHIAVTNAGVLVRVTTCTNQALTSGGTVDIGGHDHELGDPS